MFCAGLSMAAPQKSASREIARPVTDWRLYCTMSDAFWGEIGRDVVQAPPSGASGRLLVVAVRTGGSRRRRSIHGGDLLAADRTRLYGDFCSLFGKRIERRIDQELA